MPSDNQSRLAFATAAQKSLDHVIEFQDEANEVLTTHPDKLNVEGKKRREMQKKLMTDLSIAFQRNAEQRMPDGTTQRTTESVSRSCIRALLACTNDCQLPPRDPIMDRVRYWIVFPWRRSDTDMSHRVLFQEDEGGTGASGGDALQVDAMKRRSKDAHALTVWIAACQASFSLSPLSLAHCGRTDWRSRPPTSSSSA